MYQFLKIKFFHKLIIIFFLVSNLSYAGSKKPKGCANWSSQKVLKMASPYLPIIKEETKNIAVSEELVKAIIVSESCFNRVARSHAGALGLMQLMPATAKRFGVNNRLDARENIQGGIRYLIFLTNKFKKLEDVIAGYNAGEGAVMKYSGVPPYRETKQYLINVLHVYRSLLSNGESNPTPNTLQKSLQIALKNTEQNLSGPTFNDVETVNTKPDRETNGFVKWKVSPMKAALSGFQ